MLRPGASGTHASPQSSAMTEKCVTEKNKLRTIMKERLQDDMCRLLELGTQSDVTLHMASATFKLHKCIMRHRCPAGLLPALTVGHGNQLISAQTCIVQQALRSIYSDDIVDTPLCHAVFAHTNMTHTNGRDTDHSPVTKEISSVPVNTMAAFDDDTIVNEGHLVSCLEKALPQADGENEATTTTSSGFQLFTSQCEASYQIMQSKLAGNTSQSRDSVCVDLEDRPIDRTPLIDRTDNNITVVESASCGCRGNCLEGATEPCSQLGKDLLQMYTDGVDTDICLRLTTGETFLAHRCMLSLRSSYFTAMFNGDWRESDATEVTLHGVSPAALHISLQFIYGGVCELPPTCQISKLLFVADLYEIDLLKDVVIFKLKRDKCHFFHKPCSVCVVGVAEVLGLAFTYYLKELRDRAVRWTTRYFPRVWSSQSFAELPDHVHQHCLKAVVVQITNATVIETVTDCDTLVGSLSSVKWSQPVVAMATAVMNACVEHLRMNFTEVLGTDKFKSMSTVMAMGLGLLEEVLCRAVLSLPMEHACSAFMAVHCMKLYTESEECTYMQDFCKLVVTLYGKCENYMVSHVNQLIDTFEWRNVLSADLQAKIIEDACYVCIHDKKSQKSPPKLSSSEKCKKRQLKKSTLCKRQPNARKSVAANIPGTSQTANSPGTSQTVNIPVSSQAANIPGTSQTVNSPGTSQTANIPGMSQTANIPGMSQTVNIPGMSQTVNIPGTSHTVNIPGTSQTVNTSESCDDDTRMTTRFLSRNNVEHLANTPNRMESCSVMFTEPAFVPFIRINYIPAQQL